MNKIGESVQASANDLRAEYWDSVLRGTGATRRAVFGLLISTASGIVPENFSGGEYARTGVMAVGVYIAGLGIVDKVSAMKDEFQLTRQMKKAGIPFLEEET